MSYNKNKNVYLSCRKKIRYQKKEIKMIVGNIERHKELVHSPEFEMKNTVTLNFCVPDT